MFQIGLKFHEISPFHAIMSVVFIFVQVRFRQLQSLDLMWLASLTLWEDKHLPVPTFLTLLLWSLSFTCRSCGVVTCMPWTSSRKYLFITESHNWSKFRKPVAIWCPVQTGMSVTQFLWLNSFERLDCTGPFWPLTF